MADQYYQNVALLLPMNGTDNAQTFVDWSPLAKTITSNGGVKTEIDQYKFYDSSGYFSNSSSYLTCLTGDEFNFGTDDFTIEMWVRTNSASVQQDILIKYTSYPTDVDFMLGLNSLGKVTFQAGDNAAINIAANTALSANTWGHIAVVRSSGTTKIYVNGTGQTNTHNGSVTIPNGINVLKIGGSSFGTPYTGYLQDLRITSGVARYTTDFTPPDALISKNISGTIYNIDGDPVKRTVIAVPRTFPCSIAWSTQSSDADGTYSLTVPDIECSRIVLADEATLYNDIVDRIIPG